MAVGRKTEIEALDTEKGQIWAGTRSKKGTDQRF